MVPITIPYNGFILPNDRKLLMRPVRPLMILHEPIPTTEGMTEADTESLKQRVREVIEQELTKCYRPKTLFFGSRANAIEC